MAFHQHSSTIALREQGIKLYEHDTTGRLFDQYGFTVKVCGRCGGYGYLSGLEHVENSKCFKCWGAGYHFTPKVLMARQNFVADTKAAIRAARAAGQPDPKPEYSRYWAMAGVKIEDDVAAAMI